uniref:Sex-regulated protein janus-B n=1 Tax=Glossina palpalis gambiensis TaxID=67801 RepID=A0A1B0BQC5_9MUSC
MLKSAVGIIARYARRFSLGSNAVPNVDIEEGQFKYVLIKIKDRGNSGVSEKTIVRGYKDCKWHSDIYERCSAHCQAMGLETEVLGGGKIEHDPSTKKIKVFGESTGYGKADHEETKKILLTKYPDYTIEVTE